MAKTKFSPEDVPGPDQAKTSTYVDPADDTEGHAHSRTFTEQPGPDQAKNSTYVDPDDDTEGHAKTQQ